MTPLVAVIQFETLILSLPLEWDDGNHSRIDRDIKLDNIARVLGGAVHHSTE